MYKLFRNIMFLYINICNMYMYQSNINPCFWKPTNIGKMLFECALYEIERSKN